MAERLLREPLVSFLALGAGLFLLFGVVGDSDSGRADRIVVSAGQTESLVAGWTRTWRRPPTSEERNALIEDYVREEIFYREALAMGLDRDDTIVRRRLRQKMEFIWEDLAAAAEPTQEQLREYLETHADAFRGEQRISFAHVYLNHDRRGKGVLGDAEALLARLDQEGGAIDPVTLGDPLPLPRAYESLSVSEVARLFGQDFATQLTALPAGRWVGPVESGYGVHLVLIRQRTEGTVPELAEVRNAVRREWQAVRRAEMSHELYRRLRERYTVTVEPYAAEGAYDLAQAGVR